MADGDDPIVLSNLVGKTTKSGKQRFRIEISAEPIVINLNPKELGLAMAASIAQVLRERVSTIAAPAAPATIKARASAAKALAAGKRWAMKRYAGGRIGALAPNQSNRLFNDSMRFAKSLVVGPNKEAWTVNVAANRLDPETAGVAGVQQIFAKLVSLVPEFGNPGLLLDDVRVRRAMNDAMKGSVTKLDKTKDKVSDARARLTTERAKEWLNFAKDLIEFVASGG